MKSSRTARATACGVTPQAQNTGTIAGLDRHGITKIGLPDIRNSDARRVADVDGSTVSVRIT